ncbi:MAG: hypothetical protein J1F18_13805 [Lachnospiraceae bacterium]|nr:hypothetical protein [Lachnospiraceae bacterium]
MMSPTMKALYTYLWNTGNALSNIRLLVEGAVTLYENDAPGLCQLALSQQDQTAAIAFNTIGTALYDLRQNISNMQKDHILEANRQDDGNKMETDVI